MADLRRPGCPDRRRDIPVDRPLAHRHRQQGDDARRRLHRIAAASRPAPTFRWAPSRPRVPTDPRRGVRGPRAGGRVAATVQADPSPQPRGRRRADASRRADPPGQGSLRREPGDRATLGATPPTSRSSTSPTRSRRTIRRHGLAGHSRPGDPRGAVPALPGAGVEIAAPASAPATISPWLRGAFRSASLRPVWRPLVPLRDASRRRVPGAK